MRAPNESVEMGLLRMLADDFPNDAHNTCFQLGMAIVRHPQAHIDALVEAGLLRKHQVEGENLGYHRTAIEAWTSRTVYEVVQPHTHTLRVTQSSAQTRQVQIACDGCDLEFWQNNRLPIEFTDVPPTTIDP